MIGCMSFRGLTGNHLNHGTGLFHHPMNAGMHWIVGCCRRQCHERIRDQNNEQHQSMPLDGPSSGC